MLSDSEIKTIKAAAFALEAAAHLRGLEAQLLPVAEGLREMVAAQQVSQPANSSLESLGREPLSPEDLGIGIGFAVVVFSPEELGPLTAAEMESHLFDKGWEYISLAALLEQQAMGGRPLEDEPEWPDEPDPSESDRVQRGWEAARLGGGQ